MTLEATILFFAVLFLIGCAFAIVWAIRTGDPAQKVAAWICALVAGVLGLVLVLA